MAKSSYGKELILFRKSILFLKKYANFIYCLEYPNLSY